MGKNEEERAEIREQNNKILKQYIPYNSSYNSMSLWALNGIVPDDSTTGGMGINIFSDKDCAIIDGLEEHLEEIISLKPTDTAIKGNVKLSNQAIILLRKERYEALSQEEKDKLLSLNLNIFEGDLTEAISKTLRETGRYIPEILSLESKYNGYIPSETSEELKETINQIARENKIPQEFHYYIITQPYICTGKLEGVKKEFDNKKDVQEFYRVIFFEYLFSKMDISENLKVYIRYNPNGYVNQLCDEIKEIGIDEYKKIVDRYNFILEQLRESGKLPTPQEIVNSIRENKKIDLIIMIEQMDKQLGNIREVSISEVGEVAAGENVTGITKFTNYIEEKYESLNIAGNLTGKLPGSTE